jgi:hypothetical protein
LTRASDLEMMKWEVNPIPYDWHLVHKGMCHAGDKYWDPERLAWLPITVNSRSQVKDHAAVIRRDDEQV